MRGQGRETAEADPGFKHAHCLPLLHSRVQPLPGQQELGIDLMALMGENGEKKGRGKAGGQGGPAS